MDFLDDAFHRDLQDDTVKRFRTGFDSTKEAWVVSAVFEGTTGNTRVPVVEVYGDRVDLEADTNVDGDITCGLVNGVDVTALTLQTDTAGLSGRVTSLESFRSSTSGQLNNYGSRISSLESFRSSTSGQLNNYNSRIRSLESFRSSTSNYGTRISNLESFRSSTSSFGSRINSLESFRSSASTSLTAYGSRITSNDADIAVLQAFQEATETTLSALENTVTSLSDILTSDGTTLTVEGNIDILGCVIHTGPCEDAATDPGTRKLEAHSDGDKIWMRNKIEEIRADSAAKDAKMDELRADLDAKDTKMEQLRADLDAKDTKMEQLLADVALLMGKVEELAL
ncbi:MAG: hypothetical protein SGARI_001212 [Bacillariaceae sp.]